MTELEWQSSSSYFLMGECLLKAAGSVRGEPPAGIMRGLCERSIRLLACAIARGGWAYLGLAGKNAVELGEEIALCPDGVDAWFAESLPLREGVALEDAENRSRRNPHSVASRASVAALERWVGRPYLPGVVLQGPGSGGRDTAGANLLREIAGNPYRPLWGHLATVPPLVRSLAWAAVDGRLDGFLEPACLAVLSDALEDAGCQDDFLKGHLRQPGRHPVGCWAVFSLLGLSESSSGR